MHRYRAVYPVFTDRIHVNGQQWVEYVSATRCWLHARIKVKVEIAIVGGTLERWIEGLVRQAYDDLPKRAHEYAMLSGLITGSETDHGPSPLSTPELQPPATTDPPPAALSTSVGEAAGGTAVNGIADADVAAAAPAAEAPRHPLVRCLAPVAAPAAGSSSAKNGASVGSSSSNAPTHAPTPMERLSFCLVPELQARLGEGTRSARTVSQLKAENMALRASLARTSAELSRAKNEAAQLTDELHTAILALKSLSEAPLAKGKSKRSSQSTGQARAGAARANAAAVPYEVATSAAASEDGGDDGDDADSGGGGEGSAATDVMIARLRAELHKRDAQLKATTQMLMREQAARARELTARAAASHAPHAVAPSPNSTNSSGSVSPKSISPTSLANSMMSKVASAGGAPSSATLAYLKNELAKRDAQLKAASAMLDKEKSARTDLAGEARQLRARLSDAEAAKALQQQILHEHLGGEPSRAHSNVATYVPGRDPPPPPLPPPPPPPPQQQSAAPATPQSLLATRPPPPPPPPPPGPAPVGTTGAVKPPTLVQSAQSHRGPTEPSPQSIYAQYAEMTNGTEGGGGEGESSIRRNSDLSSGRLSGYIAE